jgi:hypothetical protein
MLGGRALVRRYDNQAYPRRALAKAVVRLARRANARQALGYAGVRYSRRVGAKIGGRSLGRR